MVPSSSLLVFILVAVSHVCALVLPQDENISVRPPTLPKSVAVAVSCALDNLVFTVNLTIGNNYQPMVLQLDTTRDGLWVNPDCAKASGDATTKRITNTEGATVALCAELSRYIPEKSATAKNLTEKFSFQDGNSSAVGTYFRDNIRINERMVKDLHVGVANESNGFEMGRLGLAPPNAMDEYETLVDAAHKDLLARLQSQGLIERRAFSLSLPRAGKQGGALIFGGIDTKKYKGNLSRFAMQTNSYRIPLTDVGQSRADSPPTTYDRGFWAEGNATSAPALLDSTFPFVVLPDQLAMVVSLGYPKAKYDRKQRRFLVPCEAPSGTFDFSFGDGESSTTIHVPYANFVFQASEKNGAGDSVCVLGIIPGATKSVTLGGAFLQGAHVVFDPESREVWIGEVDDCGEEIVTFTEDGVVPVVEGCKGE